VIWLQTPAGRVEAWLLPPTAPVTGPAPLLLFTHGNGELIDYWPEAFDEPRSWGLAVLLLEYPGYGRSEGRPSERTIRDAVFAADAWARSARDLDPTRIVPYGRSLGGSAAAILAAERPVPALILESAFTSARAFANRFGAPGFLVRDPLDTLAALGRFAGPVLVLHGDRDDIVPADHGRALAAASPRAALHLLACGHNDCPRAWTLVRRFLDAHHLLPNTPTTPGPA
jgi:pimeloyl-ACP methyl ester carboxylesterase